jgi:flagellar assembly factor FliW
MAFLLVDPFPVFPDYAVDLPGGSDETPPMVLSVVTLPREDDEPCTANLQAPVLLDLERRTGHQTILGDAGYGARHPFDLRVRLKLKAES